MAKIGATHKSFISLFSGCGGFDVGFLEAGLNCLGAFDIDRTVLDTHSLNLSGPVYRADLSSGTLSCDSLKPALVIAGSPCQGFSTAGKRDVNDARNHLLIAAAKIGIELRPRVFVAENVAGAISGSHKRYWEKTDSLLRTAGYQTRTVNIQATELGMAQLRRRVVLIAWKGTTPPIFRFDSRPTTTLWDALCGLPEDGVNFAVRLVTDSIADQIASKIAPGQKLSNVRGGPRAVPTWAIPSVFGKTTQCERLILCTVQKLRRQKRTRASGDADPISREDLVRRLGWDVQPQISSLIKRGYLREIRDLVDLTNTFNGKFRRLAWDAPSLTVDTRFGEPRYFLHPDENRGFSPREAARLQGFNDGFRFLGTPREQFRMIGNAVPPPLSRLIAKMVSPVLNGRAHE